MLPKSYTEFIVHFEWFSKWFIYQIDSVVPAETKLEKDGWKASTAPARVSATTLNLNAESVTYPFLGFDVIFKASMYEKDTIYFTLGSCPLWKISFDEPSNFVKVTQAFQLVSLGILPLREALLQVFITSSLSGFNYDTSASPASNYFRLENFQNSSDEDGKDAEDKSLGKNSVLALVNFIDDRVYDLSRLAAMNFDISDMSALTGKEEAAVKCYPFFFSSLGEKREIFKKAGDEGYLRMLEIPDGVPKLAVLLSNHNSDPDLDYEQAKVLNALEIAGASSKAGFIYDWLRVKSGGENFDGEPVPDPIETLKNIGVSDLLDEAEVAKMASNLGSMKEEVYDRLINAPITKVKDTLEFIDASLKKHFLTVAAFWKRFLAL